ncbi:MAG: DUF3576 domain-containing protein [Alphaproteobacteria bacterium]
MNKINHNIFVVAPGVARCRHAHTMLKSAMAGLLALSLAACSGGLGLGDSISVVRDTVDDKPKYAQNIKGNVSDGFDLIGGDSDKDQGAKIGVNALLWRASLDTVSFMPLASADPFGGLIITDWYSAPDKSGERFKITVYILDKRLRADAVRVSFFRQTKKGNRWRDAAVGADSARKIEDQILTRARQLRIAQVSG